jgi:hypothetical protein
VTAPAFDARELFRALARHDVAYVTVGGIAVQAHGGQRLTQDLDRLSRRTPRTSDGSRPPSRSSTRAFAALGAGGQRLLRRASSSPPATSGT